jgi:molybdate transport system ATP-binding protein
MLDGGRCLGCGDYAALLSGGPEIQLADRLGLINLLTVDLGADASSDQLLCGRLGDQPLWMPAWNIPTTGTIRVGLRPEDVALAHEPIDGVSMQNQIPGIVLDKTAVHGLVYVHVRLTDEQRLVAKVTPRACRQLHLEAGSRVLCLFKASALHQL